MFQSVRVGRSGSSSVLVVGFFKGATLDKATKAHDTDRSIAASLKRTEATGELGSIVESFGNGYDRVLAVGLGAKDSFSPGSLRMIAGAMGRRLAALGGGSVLVDFADPCKSARLKPDIAGSALGEGLGLIAWTCDEFRGSATTLKARPKLVVRCDDAAFAKGMRRGLGLAEGANLARTLSNTPPNICTPAYMAAAARKVARQTGMTCRILKGAQLEAEGLTGLINVGKASEFPPCLIRLEYKPKRARKGAKPIVIVGKTMTYDSGGLSIKVGGGMRGMKRDKDGGCGVLGAMLAIATTIKPDRPVVAILVSAENAISDEAYRPDDVLTFRNGVTVEITNTDAEGRLVLADALAFACDKDKPAMLIDVATLTGGVITALGSTYGGMWCEDDALRAKIEEASAISGEPFWRLPLHQEYRDMMKSDVADILNSNANRKAHPIQGAAFLSYFVDENVPWCHLDIAGMHMVESDTGPFVKNSSTAFGVRMIAELLDL